jgi:cation/acetate symporter
VIAVIGGETLNVSYMVGLAFAVAASANFPALLLALTWKRFNTTGAVVGVLSGAITSIGLVLIGPDVRTADPIIELSQPAIISVPVGFLGCILGTLLSRPEAKATAEFEELHVRSLTGLGAEVPLEGAGLRPGVPRRPRTRAGAVATTTQLHP